MGFKYGGFSKVGFKRENNEDFLLVKELDPDAILAVIADGAGSEPSKLQPAQLACRKISETITRVYDHGAGRDLLLKNAEVFLKESVMMVNQILGAFKTANEEIYSGFSAALTCVLFFSDGEKLPV